MPVASAPTSLNRTLSVDLSNGLQIAVLVAVMAALYLTVIPDLAVEWWTEESSSYGMLVPPMAICIALQRRRLTWAHPALPDARGLWVVGASCVMFLAGRLAAEFYLSRISLVFLLAGITWTFWGWPRFRTLLFPFVLLGTMVPLPAIVFTAAAAPLQLFASAVATDLAQRLGVSIYRDGNIIQLAGISLGVAEACSGLNSLCSLAVGALLLGFIEASSMKGSIALFVLSIPLAIAVNVVRVTGTAVLADYRPAFATGFYHAFSGWLLFVFGFAMLWLLAKLMFRRNHERA